MRENWGEGGGRERENGDNREKGNEGMERRGERAMEKRERERGCDEHEREEDDVRGAVVCPQAALFEEGQGCGGG